MRRLWIGGLVLGVLTVATQSAQAQWTEAKHHSHVDFARNNSWPQPFRGQDARSVIAPFEVMKNNGWRDNNTVGNLMFKDGDISEAGRLKIAQILTVPPPSRRVVYIQAAPSAKETEARIQSVQVAISQMVPTGPLPEVVVTNVPPSTSSGSYQTFVHRAIANSTPVPRLPAFSGINAPSAQTSAAPQDSGN